MTDPEPPEEATLFPKTAGEKLKEAREAQGLSLAEIASRTRIPIRQLEAIETGNFALLPSVTYSVGFAKAYARAVGIDEVAIAREVRGQNDQGVRRTEYEAYEITEPSRTPPNGLVIGSVVMVVLLMVAVGLWYGTTLFRGEDSPAPAPVTESEIAAPAPAPTPAPVTGGQVALVATSDVWLRIYDATGKVLFENTMKAGDRYDVPADANNPMINVGRPDQLQVLLNGSQVAPLGDGRVAIKDVPISGTALAARANGTPVPATTPTPGATPVAGASPAALPPAFATPTRRPAPRPATRQPAAQPTPAPVFTPIVTPPPAATVPPAAPTPTP